MARRAQTDRQDREYMIMALEYAAVERRRRNERSRISGEVIDAMRVGDDGTARVSGRVASLSLGLVDAESKCPTSSNLVKPGSGEFTPAIYGVHIRQRVLRLNSLGACSWAKIPWPRNTLFRVS